MSISLTNCQLKAFQCQHLFLFLLCGHILGGDICPPTPHHTTNTSIVIEFDTERTFRLMTFASDFNYIGQNNPIELSVVECEQKPMLFHCTSNRNDYHVMCGRMQFYVHTSDPNWQEFSTSTT